MRRTDIGEEGLDAWQGGLGIQAMHTQDCAGWRRRSCEGPCNLIARPPGLLRDKADEWRSPEAKEPRRALKTTDSSPVLVILGFLFL